MFFYVACPGVMVDASVGEASHQPLKRSNKSSAGRDPPAHYVRRANTVLALHTLAAGNFFRAKRFNRKRRQTEVVTVKAGEGCSRVLSDLCVRLKGGLTGESDVGGPQAKQELLGQQHAGATWTTVLRQRDDPECNIGGWEQRLRASRLRPDGASLLRAYEHWYSCGQSNNNAECNEPRCPLCWSGDMLEDQNILCTQYKFGAPLSSSSGLGRWRGGNVRHAAQPGPRLNWALGSGAGEDVILHANRHNGVHREAADSSRTLGKILYFFEHKGNKRCITDGEAPMTSWCLVHDYATAGRGQDKLTDRTTLHQVYNLRGRGQPLIYPTSAIVKHVHMFHQCPIPRGTSSQEWTCGPSALRGSTRQSGIVWQHHYRLADPESGGLDRYMLNEFHHCVNRDSFV